MIRALLPPAVGLAASPLLFAVINRTKAFFAGRRGPPLLQPYFDLWKLLQKGATYSRTTTWVFRAGPVVGLACSATALLLLPWGNLPALVAFPGDFVLFAYLLSVGRFFTVLAALDTGSSFEGMGASREVFFSALSEPALFLGLAAVAVRTRTLCLSEMVGAISPSAWAAEGPSLVLVCAALFAVLLAENARIPVDDPTTHLELTMIHEVMVLDHSGPDLAFIQWGAAVKLWLFGSLLVGLAVPVRTGDAWLDGAAFAAGMLAVAVLVGVVESCMARVRLVRVPVLILGAAALTVVALVLVVR